MADGAYSSGPGLQCRLLPQPTMPAQEVPAGSADSSGPGRRRPLLRSQPTAPPPPRSAGGNHSSLSWPTVPTPSPPANGAHSQPRKLGSTNLSGQLVPELGHLEHLQYLAGVFLDSKCGGQPEMLDT